MANAPDIFADEKDRRRAAPAVEIRGADIFTDEPTRGSAAPLKIGREGFADALRAVLAESGRGERALAGAGTFLDNSALRLKQLVAGLTPEDVEQVKANRIMRADPWGLAGFVGANIGTLGPLGARNPGLLSAIGIGGGAGFAEPVLEGESAARNVVGGGLGGAAGWGLGRLLFGAPVMPVAKETQGLLDKGIVPTIGQNAAALKGKVGRVLGPMIGRTEERATSLPLIGDFIMRGRSRALEEFNRAALGRANPPGETVRQIGAEGVKEAKAALGTAYDDAYAGVFVRPGNQLRADITAAKNSTALPLNKADAHAFDQAVKRNVWERLPKSQAWEAGTVKMEVEKGLREAAEQAGKDTALGQALLAARNAVRDWLKRSVSAQGSPERAASLSKLDLARANLESVRRASERASAQGGIFTPHQLQIATRRGSAPMRELADEAQAVLASRVPNSGTPERALQALLASGQVPDRTTLGYLLGSGLTAPAYSRLGSRWMLGDVTPEAAQLLAPYAGQGIRVLAPDF